MSNYSHRGYEQRTSGYGRRRHKASGFKRKSGGGTVVRSVVVLTVSVAAIALVYLFADNIFPFVNSFRNSGDPDEATPDVPVISERIESADEPVILEAEGSFDVVDKNIFVSDGCGYLLFKGIDTTAKNYAAVLNSISSSMSGRIEIFSAVIPTNTEFGISGHLEGTNPQKGNLDLISSSLSDRVTNVDLYSALGEHKNEYIFYRTDECMTSLGAYYAYEAIARSGMIDSKTLYPISALSENKGSISRFEGSLLKRTVDSRLQPHGNQELFDNADTIEYYRLPVNCLCYSVDPVSGDSRETELFSEKNVSSDPLSVFPSKDEALLQIVVTQSSEKSRLLIVKDHDAEPVIGYLVPDFSEVHIADVSLYKGNLREYVNDHEITHVIFINGIANANNSLYCQRLRDLFDNSISD